MAARAIAALALVVVAAACGYEASTSFNGDGSVTVGLKFLFPKALMQGGGTTGTVSGFSPADIAKASAELNQKYPGGKITLVTDGDESGALITIPFKNEKDAFAFMTQPSQLNPSSATSGTTPPSINLSQTGGLFATAAHTTNGQTDTYTFTTQAATIPSPSPGAQSPITTDELASIFTITFALTLPHEITSAPGALFTLDRKTAIWKVNWTKAETFTATTGPQLAGFAATGVQGPSTGVTVGVGVVAIAVGFLLGAVQPWRRRLTPAVAAAPVTVPQAPVVFDPPPGPPGSFSGPPPGAPPPPATG
ncbi:MAG TPA: hypothetical protein VNG04_04850 [Candidatus Acidoferrum sp.]|nr:hypothetical protein [Candidatus Acidoferrum sp.]